MAGKFYSDRKTDRAANRKPATSPDRCDHIIVQLTQAVGLEVPV